MPNQKYAVLLMSYNTTRIMQTRVCPKVSRREDAIQTRAKSSADAPDQSWLIEAVDKKPSEERYKSALAHMAEIRDKMDVAMTEHELDSVVAPMDSPISSLSTASGRSYIIVIIPR